MIITPVTTPSTYLLLSQAAHNNSGCAFAHQNAMMGMLCGGPMILCLLFISFGIVFGLVFEWERGEELCLKAAMLLVPIMIIGFIVALFLS